MAHAKDLLTDPEKTALSFVTLPEALPIAVIRRFINWLHEFGILVGGVVVNMVIEESGISEQADEFVLNRVAILPLFETEVRGVNMLTRTADLLFA